MPRDAVVLGIYTATDLKRKKDEKRKIFPRTLQTQMPPLVEEGGNRGAFSGVGYCVPAPSLSPPQCRGLLPQGFLVGQ